MTSKRIRLGEAIAPAADPLSRFQTPEAAESAIRQLLKGFGIDPTTIQHTSGDPRDRFANVTYRQAAPHVGLEPWEQLGDMETFKLHCSRIPTDVFRAIVGDMDAMLMQYGPLSQDMTVEARSRFFSPIFNHLVKLFGFALRNEPETLAGGRVAYFFTTSHAVAALCVETNLKVGNDVERLGAIAQAIAMCDECDLANAENGLSLPVHCILCDGPSFEFFQFERSPDPTFRRGCFRGAPAHLQRGVRVPDFQAESARAFILRLRCACEAIFDVLLSAYVAGVEAYNERCSVNGKGPSPNERARAMTCAENALEMFRKAEDQRRGGDVHSANTTVGQALLALKDSTGTFPTKYHPKLIMSGWDDAEVEKGDISFF